MKNLVGNACPVCAVKIGELVPQRCQSCGCILRFTQWLLPAEIVRRLDGAVKKSGFPPEAFELVYTVVLRGSGKISTGRGKLSTAQVFQRVWDQAFFRFEDGAVEMLASWNLRQSQDVGAVVGALRDAGLVQGKSGAELQQFTDLGAFADLAKLPNLVRGQCRKCGYDLRGSSATACPECGTARIMHRPQKSE